MPIIKRFTPYIRENVKLESDKIGVYEIANSKKNVIYIGRGQIKVRLVRHSNKNSDDYIPNAKFYRIEYFGDDKRGKQREKALLNQFHKKHHKYPRHNFRLGEIPDLL